eukprot:1774276-Rhodomonas_salina.1
MRQSPPPLFDGSASSSRASKLLNQNCQSAQQALMLEDPMAKVHGPGHAMVDELVTQLESSSPRSTRNCDCDPFSVQSLGFNVCCNPKQPWSSINMSQCQRDQIKQVLQNVCEECHLQHAEVMYPTPAGMIISSDVTWCASQREMVYHEKTAQYIFPPTVGIPGRVLADKKMEWHQDVSALPERVFLRKNIATDAGLK